MKKKHRISKNERDVLEARAAAIPGVATQIRKIITAFIMWGALVLIVRELAGKVTIATVEAIGFQVIDTQPILVTGIVFLCILLLISVGYILILKQKVRRIGKRNQQLEGIIDSQRSTSGLTSDGSTHPND